MKDANILLFEYYDKKLLLGFVIHCLCKKTNPTQSQESSLDLTQLLSGILEPDLLLFDFNDKKQEQKETLFPELLHVSQKSTPEFFSPESLCEPLLEREKNSELRKP